MNVAVIGTGNIGSRVAKRLAEHGTPVVVANSSLEHAQEAAKELGSGITGASAEDAVAGADVVVLATMFASMMELIPQLGEKLTGKIVVDPSNNIGPGEDGNFKDLNDDGRSAGQKVAEALPSGARYVKAFGTLFAPNLEDTEAADGNVAALPYATDDPEAGQKIAELIQSAGWDTVNIGGIDDTARIEMFGDLHSTGGFDHQIPSAAMIEAKL